MAKNGMDNQAKITPWCRPRWDLAKNSQASPANPAKNATTVEGINIMDTPQPDPGWG